MTFKRTKTVGSANRKGRLWLRSYRLGFAIYRTG